MERYRAQEPSDSVIRLSSESKTTQETGKSQRIEVFPHCALLERAARGIHHLKTRLVRVTRFSVSAVLSRQWTRLPS